MAGWAGSERIGCTCWVNINISPSCFSSTFDGLLKCVMSSTLSVTQRGQVQGKQKPLSHKHIGILLGLPTRISIPNKLKWSTGISYDDYLVPEFVSFICNNRFDSIERLRVLISGRSSVNGSLELCGWVGEIALRTSFCLYTRLWGSPLRHYRTISSHRAVTRTSELKHLATYM